MKNKLNHTKSHSQKKMLKQMKVIENVMKGEKMGKILADYPSKSSPGKSYHVIEPNGGGEPYCDCWQWKRNRTCQHLDLYRGGGRVKYTELKVNVKNNLAETDFDKQIADAVNNVINGC